MADNVDVTAGTGTTVAADDIGGVKHQRVKVVIGADGVSNGDISASNPMPTYTPDSNPPLGRYATRIEVIPVTLTAGTVYWALYNAGTTQVGIDNIELQSGFIGTSASTISYFEIKKFTAAANFTGGTSITASKFRTSYPASSVVKVNSGTLTPPAGVVYDQYFHEHMVRSESRVADSVSLQFGHLKDALWLAPGEGVCIAAESTAVLGAVLVGSVWWHEFTT